MSRDIESGVEDFEGFVDSVRNCACWGELDTSWETKGRGECFDACAAGPFIFADPPFFPTFLRISYGNGSKINK